MNLGAFSVSLAVKDINKSLEFYLKLGFKTIGGDSDQGWLILKNGDHVLGLFQGMFDKNLMTFNPGWDQNSQKLEKFEDIRSLNKNFKDQGLDLVQESDSLKEKSGPASFCAVDPDGNTLLFDQHV